MKHASVVVTAEHNAPVYPTELDAFAKTGDKSGSGHNCRWAVWLVKGRDVELIAFNLSSLSVANERAMSIAKEIQRSLGKDELGDRTRITRTG